MPEILQNPIARVSRGGIHKTVIQAVILQNLLEVEFINHGYRKNDCKILLENSEEVGFIEQKYKQRC